MSLFIKKGAFLINERTVDNAETENTGVGLVIVCDLEPAEFYSESLKSKGISSSIEKED